MRPGGAVLAAAQVAPNGALLYYPVVVLGGSWWVGLVVVAVFLAVVCVASRFLRSTTERAVDRALRSGDPSGVSWALVDTEAKRRSASRWGPVFWILLGLVGLGLWAFVDKPDPSHVRAVGVVLLVLSCAAAAAGERVLRGQAARWLAAGPHDAVAAGPS